MSVCAFEGWNVPGEVKKGVGLFRLRGRIVWNVRRAAPWVPVRASVGVTDQEKGWGGLIGLVCAIKFWVCEIAGIGRKGVGASRSGQRRWSPGLSAHLVRENKKNLMVLRLRFSRPVGLW